MRARSQTMSMKEIGSLLRRMRERAGMTQREIAAEIGVSYSVVSKWETGAREPTQDKIDRWAEATGHTIELLVWDSGDDGPAVERMMASLQDDEADLLRELAATIPHLTERERLILAQYARLLRQQAEPT